MLLLALTFAIRAFHPSQAIVENYVGRQVPTAMVARNLERGSGFLRPELDTGPFPNLFLVEPPIYAWIVATTHRLVGFDWETAGRLISALATTWGSWGLFGLVARREGRTVALLALGSFAAFPVTVRYGRAFQPDALMLGFVLAGLRFWDEFEATGRGRWAVYGGFVLAIGLAIKITSAWTLIPFVLIVRRWPIAWRLGVGGLMLAPALAWYVHAWGEVARPLAGSMASSDNAAIWFRSLSLWSWLRPATWSNIGRNLAIRSFTPIGFVLAGVGLWGRPRVDRLWIGWGIGCGLAILGLASKWHHAYYWMVLAPLAAVGVARGMIGVGRSETRIVLGSFFLGCCAIHSVTTWLTPGEWAGLDVATREIRELVPPDAPLIAPEAVLYLADRRGFRLEFDPPAVRRAAGELGESLPKDAGPLALVELYRVQGGPILPVGARGPSFRDLKFGEIHSPIFAADLGMVERGSPRSVWRAAIRSRPDTTILVDRPGLMLAELH
ncbi:ArnT family glycosyltransferase [Tundrisphaera lichenicola]|uniref:ArnT family glycosyltransferase n=1 Tax=Tundrisphaera lichenicola TaxID=2029860 RepID=UPI003EBFBF78